jgi:putative addiction module antidote
MAAVLDVGKVEAMPVECYHRRMNAPVNLRSGAKLIKIGNSVGIVLPREVLAKMGVDAGDRLSIADNPSGITLSPYDPTFEVQMVAARDVMKRRRNALRELAK